MEVDSDTFFHEYGRYQSRPVGRLVSMIMADDNSSLINIW